MPSFFPKKPITLILRNANALTLDPRHPTAKSIEVGNGLIVNLGSTKHLAKRRSPNIREIDCRGKTVLPGFIDAHCHLHAFAESLITLDLTPKKDSCSIRELQELLRERSRSLPQNDWLRARGYNEFYFEEKRHPTRHDLDAAVPHHAVKLTHRSGHAHVLNSVALKRLEITAKTPDPPGGLIDRDVSTGEPTGLLYEMGGFLSKCMPPLDKEEFVRGIKLANHSLLSSGITSVQDASQFNGLKRWKDMCSWKEEGLFKPRINFMLGQKTFEQFPISDFKSFMKPAPKYQISISGVKVILDETTGQLHPPQTELNEMVLEIHRSGFQVVIHAIEENAVESACSAIQYALDKIPRSNHRHRIEHCSVCGPNLSKRLASLGIIVVTQPSFVFYNGERYLRTVSALNLKHLYPIGTLMKAGIYVAASSDCPIVPPNPMVGIYSAVSRKSHTGKVVSLTEQIEPLDALRMYTINAARASFEEQRKGSITPGKLADLVVLNGDPSVATANGIKDIEVEMTILNGEVVWEKEH